MVTKTKRISAAESSGRGTRSRAPAAARGGVRWNVEQRLAFIEERLFWLGAVNRTDLVARFGVSMSQASADIAQYLARKPAGLDYDKSAKRYVAGETFRPVLGEPDAARLLGELRLVEFGLLAPADTTLGEIPPFATAPLPERPVDAFVLRALIGAIREREALSIRYQSMSRPELARRTIEPHALAHDGFRWHARAFDRDSGEFRDFVIGRMSAPRAAGPAQSRPEDDTDWNSFIILQIAPHPKLTEAQSRAIAIDYGIRGQSASLRVRRSLLFYALKRLGLDVPPDTRSPNDQQIVLVNRKEVEAASRRRTET
ncbi:MAG: WYL domain-containing protein [Bradyrhizobiaceae bacterium]|nr:WYL domain-containing protein [Bradyrhizobiaceae bacterium]